MLELLKRHAPLICSLLLVWSAHSLVSEELSVEAEVDAVLPAFMDELLVTRDPALPAQQLGDPFRNEIHLEAPPPELEPEPEDDPWDDTTLDGGQGTLHAGADGLATDAVALPAGLDLQLESIVDTGDLRSSARINGQLVRVGDRVLGWDPAPEAPLVTSIAGTGVVLRFQDEQHILNFNGRPSAHLMRRPGTAQQGGRPSVASDSATPLEEGDAP